MKIKAAIIATFIASAVAYGQGTLVIENVKGSQITPIYLLPWPGWPSALPLVKGPGFHAALYQSTGAQIGGEYAFDINGRFTSVVSIEVPGTTPGGTAQGLVLRVWDTSTGSNYGVATIKGSSPAFDN